jgi:hypothetical protein
MKRNDVFPSRHLKNEDLGGFGGQDRTVTIDEVTKHTFDDGETKPIVHFADCDKSLVCNVTNWNIIEELYGEDSDDWLGKQITLYVAKVDYGGKRVPGIRVRDQKPGGRTNGNGSSRTAALPPGRNNQEFDETEPANANGNGHAEDPMFTKYVSAVEGLSGLRTLHIERWNARWIDKKTGEIPACIKEPCSKFQLDNHLVKKAVELGHIKKESLPDGKWNPQHYGMATAALFYGPHKKWLHSEILSYLEACNAKAEAALRISNPELFDPADGPGDGETWGDVA